MTHRSEKPSGSEPYKWEIRRNDEGRTVYALVVQGYRTAVGGVIDYSPGFPPYKINMIYPFTTEWAEDLEEAKQRVHSLFISWLLRK